MLAGWPLGGVRIMSVSRLYRERAVTVVIQCVSCAYRVCIGWCVSCVLVICVLAYLRLYQKRIIYISYTYRLTIAGVVIYI